MKFATSAVLVAVVSSCMSSSYTEAAFGVAPLQSSSPNPTSTLWAKRIKRGSLGSIAQDGVVSTPKKAKASKASKKSGGKSKKSGGKSKKDSSDAAAAGVSPLLAQWAATGSTKEAPPATVAPARDNDTDDNVASSFVAFEKEPKKKRRIKQSERMEQDKKRNAQILELVQDLETAVETEKGSNEGILLQVGKLLQIESTNLRLLTSKKARYDYRLAWVGSDEALCHLGTGLHKVPLARMQEVFLTLQGRNRVEVLEVISIIGPFPNVRNTLQGDCSDVAVGEPFSEWRIQYDSMIDGTGKEILAGEEGNVRQVDLQVYFCDENALVAVVPSDSDPLKDNGKNVLVFVREPDLNDKLDKLRAL